MSKTTSAPITYELIEGKSNVLLCAPHVYDHRRPSLIRNIKSGEPWTDYIARESVAGTGAWGLILKTSTAYDANYHKEPLNPFKQTVRRISEQANIEAIIDIHGLSDENKYDIGILYSRGFNKSRSLAYDLGESLNDGRLRDALINIQYLPEELQEPIANFAASELRIPSVQIEIARYIREDEVLREEVVKLLSTFISKI